MLAGTAVAYNEGSRSIGAGSPRRIYFATRNHLMLGSRVERPATRAAAAASTLSIVLLNAAHAAISTSGSMGARFGAFARGMRDYAGGRVGDVPLDARSCQ